MGQGYKVSLMVSPIPPRDIPIDQTLLIVTTTLKKALKFIVDKELKITMQDGSSDGIQGLWVDPKAQGIGIYYGYIPIDISIPLDTNLYPFADLTRTDPIRTENKSMLEKVRHTKKIADYLQIYTLYTYSVNEKLDETDFIIIPDHVYNIDRLKKRLYIEGNKIMYSKGKLIVTSEAIQRKLLAYLNVHLHRDKPGLIKLKDAKTTDVHYQGISDFRVAEGQLLFLNKNGLLRWRQEALRLKQNSTVSPIIDSYTVEPYLFRTPKIRSNSLFLIQNVEDGDLKKAITVANKWLNDKINIGWEVNIASDIETISYRVYTITGEESIMKKETTEIASILKIFDEKEEKYAAMLFF